MPRATFVPSIATSITLSLGHGLSWCEHLYPQPHHGAAKAYRICGTTNVRVSWAKLLLEGQVTPAASPSYQLSQPLIAPQTPFLAGLHVTNSLQIHDQFFLTTARCQALAVSALCRAPHMPEGALGAWISSKGTAGTHPWEPLAPAMKLWQPSATHPHAQGGAALNTSVLQLFLGSGWSCEHHPASCCCPMALRRAWGHPRGGLCSPIFLAQYLSSSRECSPL